MEIRKTTIKFVLISIVIVGCETKIKRFLKPSNNQFLIEGEWLDSSDTLNGVSIRENKIAYFEDMHFTADEIHEYYIVDSIHRENSADQKVGEYLIVKKDEDSLIFKIEKRDKKNIVLLDSEQNRVTYNFWKRLKFTQK
jgi:hypothetical protein